MPYHLTLILMTQKLLQFQHFEEYFFILIKI